jgi:mRNA interferase MazF
MNKGDIILVPFPYTDMTGTKLRPALVLINNPNDLTVCFITSQVKWKEDTDIELFPTTQNGIKKASLIRLSKIATIDKSLATGKLGEISPSESKELNIKLKKLFKLG